MLKDNHQAKSVLCSILNNKISTNPWTVVGYNCISDLTDIIFEEFRSTSDPEQKAASLQEMKNLMSQPLLTSIGDSQTAVALALMTKKIGFTSEFGALMQKIFDTCVEGLNDQIGWNDGVSFRLLAKALACVHGLERDAQISSSSIVDPTLYAIGENNIDKEKQEDDNERDKEVKNPNLKDTPEKGNDKNSESRDGIENSPCGTVEDISLAQPCYCNGCRKSLWSWSEPIYYCILCSDCDLCEDCYQEPKICDREQGVDVTYCGRDHRHIRGPINGWKGVKEGIISVGEESFKFDDWLAGLRDKRWKEAWETFWKEHAVEGIF